MPTGSGKTALMMAACFELQLTKVLIIVPSQILRHQIYQQFTNLSVLKECGCLPAQLPDVSVYEVKNRKNSLDDWKDIIKNHDVIVAHPNSISPYYKDVVAIPSDLIDAVLVDEAHHEPAPTWQALNNFYSNKKRIFFTATPFRRDRKRMRGKLIYHYSIEKALEEDVLRPVNFQGIQSGLNPSDCTNALIATGVQAFNKEKTNNPNAVLLIRTDRIDDAIKLSKEYNKFGLSVDVIHSERSTKTNAQLIEKARNSEIDGLVCVGIASEGLDIPNLKIAILHSTPRSIPYTIQFLGRISRQAKNQSGSATLIANTDEVRGEVSRLYKSDESWSKLIPTIVSQQMSAARHFRSNQAKEIDFQLPEINIYFSALVYETKSNFAYEQNIKNTKSSILHIEQASSDDPLLIITSSDKPIEWSSREIYIEDFLDIHVFYHDKRNNLLFELTTSELILSNLRKHLIKSSIKPIPYGRLYKTLSSFNQRDYIMVGMKNAVVKGASQPSYKTIMGSSVQASVRASEGRVFSTGHALLKISNDDTWGIATRRGRVWAMQRGTIEEFKVWCDQLSQLITAGPIETSLPGLSFLASSSPVDTISEKPIAIVLDEIFFRAQSTIIDIENIGQFRNITPEISPISLDTTNKKLHCTIKIDVNIFDVLMDFDADYLWQIQSIKTILARVDKNENDTIENSLQYFLNKFPPSLIMPNGSVIEGRNRITPNRNLENLPRNIWKPIPWTNCDITAERYNANALANQLPVINKTIDIIRPLFDINHDCLILDDSANEISDLIWIQGNDKKINLIHCKPSKKDFPGCRTGDSDILFAQALRSIHWIYSADLLDRIEERIQGNSQIILGTPTIFQSIRSNYSVNEWDFQIILAQPGFLHSKVSDKSRNNNNVYELAIPMYERIRSCVADLEIWCSQ